MFVVFHCYEIGNCNKVTYDDKDDLEQYLGQDDKDYFRIFSETTVSLNIAFFCKLSLPYKSSPKFDSLKKKTTTCTINQFSLFCLM